VQIWYATNVAAATGNTVRMTVDHLAPNLLVSFHVLEYSGIDPTAPVDATGSASGVSASMSVGPVTTRASNELLFAFFASESTATATAPLVLREQPDADGSMDGATGAPGPYYAQANQEYGGFWTGAVTTFRGKDIQLVQSHSLAGQFEGLGTVALPAATSAGNTAIVAAVWRGDAVNPAPGTLLTDSTGKTWPAPMLSVAAPDGSVLAL
jgi:hypothetical protein